MIYIKNTLIFIVLFSSFTTLSHADPHVIEAPTTSQQNFLEGIETSILIASNHDAKNHDEMNSVFGSAYQLLEQAQHDILIINYIFDDEKMIQILNQKAIEGVKVRVVYDRNRSKNLPQKLHDSIIKVTRATGEGHLHHKIIVSDQTYVWISSANFHYHDASNLAILCMDHELAQVIYNESFYIESQQPRENSKPYTAIINDQKLEYYILPHYDPKYPQATEAKMNQNGMSKLISLIDDAKSHIRVSMVVWTLKDAAKALVQAASRGVKVEIVTASIDSQVAYILMNGGISFSQPNGCYHHKFMLVDNSILWNGSANWSMNAFSRTDDSVTILYNLKPAQLLYLEEAWQNLLKIIPPNDLSEQSLELELTNEIDEENNTAEYNGYVNPLINHFDMRKTLVH